MAEEAWTEVCARCRLRARGERAAAAYAAAAAAATAGDDAAGAVCRVCVGVLQAPALSDAAAQVTRAAAALRHDRRYKLAVQLPLPIALLRDRAFLRSAPAPARPLSVREALRLALAPLLAPALGRFCPDAPLLVTLSYRADAAVAADANFLAAPAAPAAAPAAARAAAPKRARAAPVVPSLTAAHKLLDAMSDRQFEQLAPHLFPLPRVAQRVALHAAVRSEPLFLAGRYCKLSRALSQTPWNVARPPGVAPVLHSVQAAVEAALRAHLSFGTAVFTAGGREDVDVRMLGSGRPFILELHNSTLVPPLVPHSLLLQVEEHLRPGAVHVHELRRVDAAYGQNMRLVEADKEKHYRCVLYTACTLDQTALRKLHLRDVLLMQKTPLRVLHRRTQMTRPKRIARVDVVRLINAHFVVVDVVAQAGTYIKEFVHGDNGRTTPSVASVLNCFVDIVQLDVTHIDHTS